MKFSFAALLICLCTPAIATVYVSEDFLKKSMEEQGRTGQVKISDIENAKPIREEPIKTIKEEKVADPKMRNANPQKK